MIALGDTFGIGGSSVISRLFGQKKDTHQITDRYLFLRKYYSRICVLTSSFAFTLIVIPTQTCRYFV